nr:histone-like nucleoid-structuring protein Lsr2 [Microbacterium sp. ZXX196]
MRDGTTSIVTPMLTARVIVQVDPKDATIRVVPEQAVELELDGVEGANVPGLDGLVALQALLRESPPDPWNSDERLAVRERISAPLGIDATLVDSYDPVDPTKAPQINDGWALFVRKRPMRQERFYDELAHKIRDEQFLPEGLASVVADRDRVDDALRALGQPVTANDGTADRLLMPLPANAEQVRIAGQLATSRGVTVQGPPGTGKSHTIVNLVSHLVAQGKRVLVTAEKEQALSVLREKIPPRLRDLSIAVLGSTPTAMEDLRSAAQSMQDSLSAIDVSRESKRITELGAKVDALRESIARTDAALVLALQSEQREYPLPSGPARAAEVSQWLAGHAALDVIDDRVQPDAELPISSDELAEMAEILRSVSADDAEASVLTLPDAEWLPTAADLEHRFARLEELRSKVTSLEDRGLRVEALDDVTLESIREHATWFREMAALLRSLSGDWEDRFAAAIRSGDPAVGWVRQHNPQTRQKLSEALHLAGQLAGHVVVVPEGNPAEQLPWLETWGARISAGKKLGMFAGKELKEFSSQVTVDGFPVTTPAQIDFVRIQVHLRVATREVHVLMTQAYAPSQIPVPPLDGSFLFAADQLAARVDAVAHWWAETYPTLATRIQTFVTAHDAARHPETLESAAELLDGAAARLEERELSGELVVLKDRIARSGRGKKASPLWPRLRSALDLARADTWAEVEEESRRLQAVRARVLRSEEIRERLAKGGAPVWARAIVESRGDEAVLGDPASLPLAWACAQARAWILSLHAETDVESLMERSHNDGAELRRAIVDLASRSARVQLKKNFKDRQRRALETWLTAVKRVGKGTGKNAPRFQAAAREALPAAMGAVPIWIMPIYRVMENFDPRVSDLFDVVVVDESSQCDLLSLGVLALGKKTVVVGDDKQTTPERVGIPTDKIAALQDQHLKGIPEARLLTLDDSLYSISGRAFPSTIALKEHFRCVPEIIGFSNRYYNNAILPLREVGVPQIGEPLRAVRVEEAVSVVQGSSRVNVDEAKAIAAQVAECTRDPSYDGLTFGVVTMMSGPQAQIIQDLVREEIGDEEFENRRLRVGNPPLFQGDERNVMFVSMVAHDASFAATSPRYSQWANVAASRAQDQLWVFHSMDPATLNHEDQRRAMIEYAQSYGRREQAKSVYELTESKFERDVLKQMLERGYDVEAQHRVGSYRIDFVVRVAAGERLAVECDGDSFHGPDKWDEDVRRQRVLERLGWTFWRIRASKYYLDPEEAMKPLWARLEEMKARAAESEDLARVRKERADAERLQALQDAARAEAVAPVATAVAHSESPEADETAPVDGPGALGAQTRDTLVAPDELRRTSPGTAVRKTPGRSLATGAEEAEPRTAAKPTSVAGMREWARANGFSIGDRGRISKEIQEAYVAAHARGGESAAVPTVSEPPSPETASRPRSAPERPRAESTARDYVEADDRRGQWTAAAAVAWADGISYQLDTQGHIYPLDSSRSLVSTIGSTQAGIVRDIMREVRPGGGRFKVDRSGVMATLVDNEPVYVCTVEQHEWFPGHWGEE